VDLSDPELAEGNRQDFLQFSSSVEPAGSGYRYSVSNFTELVVPFDWPQAGLSGELQPFGSTEVVSTSALAPGVFSSLPSWRLETEEPFPLAQDFAYRLDMLAPVPEPHRWLQLILGAAIVIAASRSRLTRRT
jgi:hypothetical protein